MSALVDLSGETFERLSCGQCGIVFYAPQTWVTDRRDRGNFGKEFHCPNGHQRVWREPTIDVIRRERDRLNQRLAEKDDEIRRERERTAETERRLSAAKGQVTKIKNRVSHGVCPCCTRSFDNLHRHMKSKHPDYTDGDKPALRIVA